MLNYRLPKEGFDSMNTRFTEQDRSILESYDSVVEGLADYLGMPPRSCCIVWKITSIPLSRLRTGIIREGNWERRSPIWLCKCCKRLNSPTRSRQSVILRGARTIVWWSRARSRSGRGWKIIGLLCININLDEPFSQVLQAFVPHPDLESRGRRSILPHLSRIWFRKRLNERLRGWRFSRYLVCEPE